MNRKQQIECLTIDNFIPYQALQENTYKPDESVLHVLVLQKVIILVIQWQPEICEAFK